MLRDVDFIFVELPVGSQTARAMASYGICVGLAAWIEVPLFVLSPAELKIAACGNKTATKEDMVNWAMTALPTADWILSKSKVALNKNEHMADALAAIVAGVRSDTFKKAMLFQ
jgi:Holliday junction resolvasome RuvABC endonuclease subunit